MKVDSRTISLFQEAPLRATLRWLKSVPFDCYLELTKPRILSLILVTTTIGFFFGGRGIHSWSLLTWTLLGVGMVVAGSASFNMLFEREIDAKMKRTQRRALPQGRISPTAALVFGAALILLGTLVLVWKVNLLTGFLGLLSAFLYVLVYTPLKRVSWINTLVGGIPGALPPMGGWAAASGELSLGAWVLFLILFVWQQPHFYAIAWLYREDYARGGLKMLPVVDPNGVSTLREILVYLALLIPLSLMPCVIGLAGKFYYVGAIVLGIYYLIPGIRLAQTRSMTDARRLLKASVLYLPLLLALIIFDASF